MPTPNEQQQKAIQSTAPVTIVQAGPGTGKTYTLIQRIAYLIKHEHVPPESILAVTFTRKATQGMKQRINTLMSDAKQHPTICTLHTLGLSILTTYTDNQLTVIDAHKQKEIIASLVQNQTIDISVKEACSVISHSKNATTAEKPLTEEEIQFMAQYTSLLEENHLLDFDDLISKPITLLKEDQNILTELQQKYQYILVDEFQDLTEQQHSFIQLLFDPNASSLFIIGDPYQSIYRFRGAEPDVFEHLKETYPTANTVTLSENYRSGQVLLNFSHTLMRDTKHTPLTAATPTTTFIQNTQAPNERLEARFVIEQIQRLIGGISRQNYDTDMIETDEATIESFSDIAVLMRNKSQFQPFKQYLLRSGLPFQFVTSNNFLSDEGIQNLLKELRFVDSKSYPDLKTVIKSLAENNDTIVKEELHELLLEADAINTGDFATDRSLFFQYLNVLTYDDQLEIPVDKITFSTIHGSKGLEFPAVFVVGLEDGLLPYYLDEKPSEEYLEEERRLLYVAVTRAKSFLYLTDAHYRHVFGTRQKREQTRFLDNVIDKNVIIKPYTIKRRKVYQQTLF